MEITLLNWSLFVFFASLYLLAYIVFWGLTAEVTNKENKGIGLLIFFCGLIAAFMFIPAKEIMNKHAAVILWKVLASITGASSILVALFNDKVKNHMHSYIWGVVFTVLISIVPFVIRITITKPTNTSLDFNNQYSINPLVFISTIILLFSLIALIVTIISTNKTRKRINEQNGLLSYYLNEHNHNLSSFKKPYETMYKEDLFSLIIRLEKKISDLIKTNGNKTTIITSQATKETTELHSVHQKVDEIQNMLILLGSKTYNKQIADFDLIRDLNHFFATPFATIEANVEILNKTKGIDNSNLEKINNSIQLCKCIIETYRDCLTFSNHSSNIISSLKDTFETAYNTYAERNHKTLLPLDTDNIPEKFKSQNNHYIVTLILPLLENAIQAAPNDTEIKINFNESLDTICISNSCETMPNLEDLNTPGYSSKENHKGTGIIIVKNLLSIKDRGILETTTDKENNKVIQTIKLNKNE